MSNTIALRRGNAPLPALILLLLLLAGLIIYLQFRTVKAATDPLVQQLAETIGVEASEAVYREAIRLAAKNLAEELGIDLENYDLTKAEYEALVAAAVERFGFCEQYRLVARMSSSFPCYSCTSKAEIFLQTDQTFKIGQTCFEEKGRYSKELPAPNLLYQKEFQGSIFEVLVAEHVKLLLFRFSTERKSILKTNALLETELIKPPGNKIFR